MKRLFLILVLMLPLVASAQIRTVPPHATTLDELLRGVHLYGCQVRDHSDGVAHECIYLRREIMAAAQRGVLTARRQALKEAARVTRTARDQKTAAEMLDRLAAD